MSENPFAVGDYAGGSVSGDFSGDPNQHPLMKELITLLSQTRPWVRLIGIMVLIGAVFMLIAGAGILVFGFAAGQPGMGPFIGGMYILMSVFYIYPGLCLNRYASAIKEAESSADMQHVVEGILQQKKFWRFCGIITAVVLVIYLLIFIVGILAAVVGAM